MQKNASPKEDDNGYSFWYVYLALHYFRLFLWDLEDHGIGEAKMIFSFASQEKNVHPLPGLLGCFCPTRQGF